MDTKKLRKLVEKRVEEIDGQGFGGTLRGETFLVLMDAVIESFEKDTLTPIDVFDPQCILNDGVEEDS